MQKLISFLQNLNSEDNSQGLFVNPDDLDDFKVESLSSENGGLPEKYKFVGTLQKLSCGRQSLFDALNFYLTLNASDNTKALFYHGKKVLVSRNAILDRWERLDEDFRNFLKEEILKIMQEWSYDDAWFLANQIDDDLAQARQTVI